MVRRAGTMAYEWIFFDIGKVLVTHALEKKRYVVRGRRIDGKALGAIYETPAYARYAIGRHGERALVEDYLVARRIPLSYEDFAALYRSDHKPIRANVRLAERLKRRYRLALLSNEGVEWAEHHIAALDRRLFDLIVISGDVGARKPSRRYFCEALRRAHARPRDCLFIDDKEANCRGARAVGITAVRYRDPAQLRRALRMLRAL